MPPAVPAPTSKPCSISTSASLAKASPPDRPQVRYASGTHSVGVGRSVHPRLRPGPANYLPLLSSRAHRSGGTDDATFRPSLLFSPLYPTPSHPGPNQKCQIRSVLETPPHPQLRTH